MGSLSLSLSASFFHGPRFYFSTQFNTKSACLCYFRSTSRELWILSLGHQQRTGLLTPPSLFSSLETYHSFESSFTSAIIKLIFKWIYISSARISHSLLMFFTKNKSVSPIPPPK